MKIIKIKPLFTTIVTTMEMYKEDVVENGIIDDTKQEGGLSEYQTVLAIGSSVRDIAVGDLVCINPSRFAIRQHKAGSMKDGLISDNPILKYNFETVEVDGNMCLMLQDRDINFVVEEYTNNISESKKLLT